METTDAVMTDASVTITGGNVVISNLHPATGEGWVVIAPPKFPVEVREHYYDDGLGRVIVTTTSYPSLVEAIRAVAEAGA